MNGRTIDQIMAERVVGCCGDASWRGRFCQYHQGMEDGLDEATDRLTAAYAPILSHRTLTRLLKARAILAEGDTHPQFRQLVDAIDTALELDPKPVLEAVQP